MAQRSIHLCLSSVRNLILKNFTTYWKQQKAMPKKDRVLKLTFPGTSLASLASIKILWKVSSTWLGWPFTCLCIRASLMASLVANLSFFFMFWLYLVKRPNLGANCDPKERALNRILGLPKVGKRPWNPEGFSAWNLFPGRVRFPSSLGPSNFPGKVDTTLHCSIFFKWRYKISSSLGFTDIREGRSRRPTHSTLLLTSECRALDSHWNQRRGGGEQSAN